MRTYKLTKYGETYDIVLVKGKYMNDTLAIDMYMVENGEIVDCWNNLTVNLPMSMARDNLAYIDTNHNGNEIIEWLEKNKIGTKTMFTGSSGYYVYPLFMFSKKALAEMEDMK